MRRIHLHSPIAGLLDQFDGLGGRKAVGLDLLVADLSYLADGLAQVLLDRVAQGVELESDLLKVGQFGFARE